MDRQPEIVGVAGHVKQWGLDSDATARQFKRKNVFAVHATLPDKLMPLVSRVNWIAVARTEGPPGDVVPAIRTALAKMNGNQVIYSVQTMDEVVANSLADRKFSMILLGVFAAAGAAAFEHRNLWRDFLFGRTAAPTGNWNSAWRLAGATRRRSGSWCLDKWMRMALAGVGIGLAAA